MIQKKCLSLFVGLGICLSFFFGCGGKTVLKGVFLRSDNNKIYIGKADVPGEVIVENWNNNISIDLDLAFTREDPILCNPNDFQQIENSINANQPIHFALKYKYTTAFVVNITANDKLIGENFIHFRVGENSEGLMRTLSIENNKLQGYAIHINPLTDLWTQAQDKTIITSALNNASQEPKHTASFTLQKTSTGDYQLSNVQISDLTLAQNNFVLKKDQYGTTDLKKLQLILSTLFVNFNKSKEIFNYN